MFENEISIETTGQGSLVEISKTQTAMATGSYVGAILATSSSIRSHNPFRRPQRPTDDNTYSIYFTGLILERLENPSPNPAHDLEISGPNLFRPVGNEIVLDVESPKVQPSWVPPEMEMFKESKGPPLIVENVFSRLVFDSENARGLMLLNIV
jgi:hypothetical protein